jgi:Zn-dependent peptidase ImmA (M78 family)
MEALLTHAVVETHGPNPRWGPGELRALAREFWVSREVILRRLLSAQRTTSRFYESARQEFAEEYRERGAQREGFAPPDVKAVADAGRTFVRLVLSNYYRERITSRDVSELLGVRLKHVGRIEERVLGRPVMFEA